MKDEEEEIFNALEGFGNVEKLKIAHVKGNNH
jgi:hypothetical protein